MTTALAGPGAIRLQREAVRIVSIPYATPFSKEGDKLTLASTASIGMGTDTIAKKRTVKARLEGNGIGVWQCPRRSEGHKGAFIHLLQRHQAPREPGYCEQADDASPDGKCGRKLRVEETHWHEMAEAFGFLESQGDSYIIGKFGQVAKFLSDTDSKPFNSKRSGLALYLMTLLEHHADFVLPVLWTISNSSSNAANWSDEVLRIFRANLSLKLALYSGERLSTAHQGSHLLRQVVETKLDAFGAVRQVSRRPVRLQTTRPPLTPGVQSAYATRARTYLMDLGAIKELPGRTRSYELTSFGMQFVSALQQERIMVNEETCHLPPSFEAIHDVFSISMDQYLNNFSPPVNHKIVERIIMMALLPDIEPIAWDKYKSELAGLLPKVIRSVGSKINDGARIDTVRLAVFLFQIGKGMPTILDDSDADTTAGDLGLRSNAIVDLAAADPDRYLLGSARVGRRLWSIHYLRSTT